MKKKNCWEILKCGRGWSEGLNVKTLGMCPAALEEKLDGVHGGKNAGRCCWIINGTLSNLYVQKDFENKFSKCKECEVYKTVKEEEYPNFILPRVLAGFYKSL